MNRSIFHAQRPKHILSIALSLVITLIAHLSNILVLRSELPVYAQSLTESCQERLQWGTELWFKSQSEATFTKMVNKGLETGLKNITKQKERNGGRLSQEIETQIVAKEVYTSITHSLYPILSKSLWGTHCKPITQDQIVNVFLTTNEDEPALNKKAGMLGIGTAGAIGTSLTTAAIAGYAVLNTGFWGTLWAGGTAAVATGALVPEPTTLAIIGVGGSMAAGGWYWWKKSQHEKSIKVYVSIVQAHVSNHVSIKTLARELAKER